MKFTVLPLAGSFLIELELIQDDRGFFARSWCQNEFEAMGLCSKLVQCNTSFNHESGTLRGMHFQRSPHAEDKLVQCTQGAIFDVIVDVREDSPTFGQWYGTELSAKNRKQLFIPKGFAHGYQTLEPQTQVFYQVSAFYQPGSECGFHYSDPHVKIHWPLPITKISPKDLALGPLI